MSKRILFVDDEPMVLQGVQRGLRNMKSEWDCEVASAGSEALERMAKEIVDVVITDMRMPGMDGAELLGKVKERYPHTIRMVLSGQSDRGTLLRAIGPTHQYLSKPCDLQALKRVLKKAFELSDLLGHEGLRRAVSQLEAVPSLPSLLFALKRELRSPEPSQVTLTEIIMQDPGMATKILQLVNSAFLGAPMQIVNLKEAISIMGVDRLRTLALTVGVFPELSDQFEPLWKHAVTVARCAQAISFLENASNQQAQEAYTAGLLHEVGSILLAATDGAKYQNVLRTVSEKKLSRRDSECSEFGATHNEVGAYLLGLWGLPESLVEVVAWHCAPSQSKQVSLGMLLAVHVAECCVHDDPLESRLDEELLTRLNLSCRLPLWRRACMEIYSNGA